MQWLNNIWDKIFARKSVSGKTECKKPVSAERVFMWVCLAAFLFTTAWILIAGHYAVPNQDDFYMEYELYQRVQDGEQLGLLDFLQYGYDKAVANWYNWGGNYTAYFFNHMQIFVLNEDYYQFEILALVLMIVSGFFYFNETLLRKFTELSKERRIIVNSLFTMLALQFVPSPYEAYYWFVGSFYNTCGMLFGLTAVAIMLTFDKKLTWYKPILAFLFLFLAGGCNYSAFLAQLLCMVLFVPDYCKNKEHKRSAKITVVILNILWIACEMFSILSPGNAARAAYSEGMGAVKAIMYSLVYGADFIIQNINFAIVLFLVMLAGITASSLKKMNFRFRNPILAAVVAFGIFSSTFTPMLYAQGEKGQPRTHDIIFFCMLYMLSFVTVYVTGWYVKKEGHKEFTFHTNFVKSFVPIMVIFILLGSVTVERKPVWLQAENGFFDTTLMSFKGFMDEREEFYRAHEGEDIVVTEIPIPEIFEGIKEIDESPSYWINDTIVTYYRVKSVRMDRSLPMGELKVIKE